MRRRLRGSTASKGIKVQSSNASNRLASCSILGRTVAPTGPVASLCIIAAIQHGGAQGKRVQVGDTSASAVGGPDQVVFFLSLRSLVPFGAWCEQAVCGFCIFFFWWHGARGDCVVLLSSEGCIRAGHGC